ncbi:MAG: hypothetical protein MH825_08095 [Cyanobacteria bacterium]|nr:hypothetical protein [Cyanobacteriota bacterium]
MTTQPPETESSCSEIMALLLEIQKETKGLQSEMFKVRGIADEALDIAEKAAGLGKDELDKKKVIQWVKEALSGNGPLALIVVGMFGYTSVMGSNGTRNLRASLERSFNLSSEARETSKKAQSSYNSLRSEQGRLNSRIRANTDGINGIRTQSRQYQQQIRAQVDRVKGQIRGIDAAKAKAQQAETQARAAKALADASNKKAVAVEKTLNREIGPLRQLPKNAAADRRKVEQLSSDFRKRQAEMAAFNKRMNEVNRTAQSTKKVADNLNKGFTNLSNTVKTTTTRVNTAIKDVPAIKRTVGVLQKDIKDFLPFKRQLSQLGDVIKSQPAVKKLVEASKPLLTLASKASNILAAVSFADRVLSEFINKKTFDVMSRRIDTLEKANAMQDKSFTQIFNQLTLIKGGGGAPAIKLTQIIPRFVTVERTIKSVEVKVESAKKEVKAASEASKKEDAAIKRDLAASKKELDATKKQSSDTAKKLDATARELDAAERKIETNAKETTALKSALETVRRGIESVKSDITKLFNETKRLSSENKTQGDYIRDLQSQIKQIPGMIDKKINDLSRAFDTKVGQLRNELTKQVRDAQAKFDAGLQAAQVKINEIIAQIKTMLTLQQLRQELGAQNGVVQGMINAQSSLIQTMINQLLGFIRAEIKDTNQNIASLGNRLSSLNSQIANIPASLDAKFSEVRQHVSNQSANVTSQVNQTIVNIQSNLGSLVQSVNTNLLNVQTNLSRQIAGIPSAVQSVVSLGIAQVNASVQNTNNSIAQFATETRNVLSGLKADAVRTLTEIAGIKNRQDLNAQVVYDINRDLDRTIAQADRADGRLSSIETKLNEATAAAKSGEKASKDASVAAQATEATVKGGVKLDNSTMGAIEQMIRFIMPGIVLAGVTAGLAGVFQLLNSIKADTSKTKDTVLSPNGPTSCRFQDAEILRRIGEPGPIPNGLSGALVTNPDSVKTAVGKPIRGLFGQPIGLTTRVNSIFNTLGLVHIFNAIGTAMSIHNGVMLSVDIKETAIDLISTVVDIAREALSLKDPDDSAIDFNDIINQNFEALMDRLLGAEKWEQTKITLAAANRIYQAQANALSAINNAFNSLFDSVGVIGTYTGRIGNGLKAAAVVPQNAYDWMDERVFETLSYTGKIRTFTSTLQNVQDAFEVMTSVATAVKEVQNGAKEIADAQKELLEARAEAALKFQQAEFIGRKNSFPDSDFAQVELKTFGDEDDEPTP